MKATLEFNLNRPEEQNAYERAMAGPALARAAWDFDNWLRDQIKHHDREDLDEVRTHFRTFMEAEGVLLDQLIQ